MSTHESDWLDEQFPLGDGTADTSVSASCPYCGELVHINLDPGSGAVQEYIEDCEVCCRPWKVVVRFQADGTAEVTLRQLDD
jgi:cysteine-rich CPXCG protein